MTQPAKNETSESVNLLNFQVIPFHTLIQQRLWWNNGIVPIFLFSMVRIVKLRHRLEDQEIAVLSLHLLQICLVYINTLMMQRILSEKDWLKLRHKDDLRDLTSLIRGPINPYGTFWLDLDERLLIDKVVLNDLENKS